MAKVITITIDEEAVSSIDLDGYHGVGCDAVMKAFTSAIGSEATVKHKAERSKACANTNKQTVQQKH